MTKKQTQDKKFIEFLNDEFKNKKSKQIISQVAKKKESKKIEKIEKISAKKKEKVLKGVVGKKNENVFGKKSGVKNRLANASKLIKTMEVFLDGKSEGVNVSYETIQGWDNIYRNMKINIAKDVDSLLKLKKNKKVKKTFVAILNQKLEYAPKGNILNYSVIVMSVFMLSFFSTAIFPNFTNRSIMAIDSLFEYPIKKITEMNNVPDRTKNVADEKKLETITREQLSEYIKNNSNKIENNQTVSAEDIAGRVAGVEE